MYLKRLVGSAVVLFLGSIPAFASEAAGGVPEGGNTMTEKMVMLAVQLGIIIFAAKIGGMLAERAKIPGVLGELVAGILIGPYALGGLLKFGEFFQHGFFPVVTGGPMPVTPELYGFCTVASILLLFVSGVETDLKLFVRYSLAGSVVGLGGVIVSFLFGNLAAVLLVHKFLGGEPVSFLSAEALFMGIMCVATSVGITARILSEQKSIDSPEGVTTMAAAVIDDVLGIIVLAIGMGVIGAQTNGGVGSVDWGSIGKLALKTFGIWLGATAVGIIAARKISSLLKMFGSELSIAIMSFGLALIVAGFFETMNLAMIIGGYVMGLALSRTDIRYVIQENLTPIYSFLVPVFFCVMGMMVDISQLKSPPVLIFGLIFSILAVLAKIIGCSIPSFFFGFNGLGALRIGAGMIPRGEVALIVAGIGLSSGFFTHTSVFSVGILMTLITTLVAPTILIELYKVKKSGLRHPKSAEEVSTPFSFVLPSREAAELMSEKLILAFRNDGFFTHRLSYEPPIWQVRSDAMEIGVTRKDNEVLFECSPSEERFVAAAVLDVSSELAQLANDLAKPVKTSRIARLLVEARPSDKARRALDPYLARYIRQFVMLPKLSAANKGEALSKMMEILYSKGLVRDPANAMRAIMDREAAMSTGLECGIAIPHVKTDLVSSLVGIVAVLENELPDYETVDGSKVRIIVMTLSPTLLQTPHLRIIAHVGKVLDEDGRARLVTARTEKEMLDVFI